MKTGEFEAHITVRCDDDGAAPAARLERWSAARGWKFTHIVLARGRTPSQPMLTLRGGGSYEEQLGACRRACAALRDAGFVPVRVKIEVAPWASVVPRSDEQARQPAGSAGGQEGAGERYFEHHLKVRLDPAGPDAAARLRALTATAVAHGAHLSWNARRTLAGDDRREERFVTQRCYGVGLPTARERLAALRRAVTRLRVEITEIEQEFVVHDSDTSVDDGWIGDGRVGDVRVGDGWAEAGQR